MVAGNWIVEDGQIGGLDLQNLHTSHNKEAMNLQLN